MLVFDIKRYSINDGPGIRITIFMKGCPLQCVWCHNPEGIAIGKEKLYTRKKCIGCQTCVKACPNKALTLTKSGIVTDRSKCTVCGICASVCPANAMEISGKDYSPEEIIAEIEKETLVMDKSNGGVTFCGGEPLLHPNELLDMLKRCGNLGVHRAVDTTLYASSQVVSKVMQETDLFLIDLKLMDSAKHQLYCGVPNGPILHNIKMVSDAGCQFWIRIPLIVGVNADDDNITSTAKFLSSLQWNNPVVNLLPYHDIGKNKHEKLGTIYNPNNYSFSTPDDNQISHIRSIFYEHGITTTIGG